LRSSAWQMSSRKTYKNTTIIFNNQFFQNITIRVL